MHTEQQYLCTMRPRPDVDPSSVRLGAQTSATDLALFAEDPVDDRLAASRQRSRGRVGRQRRLVPGWREPFEQVPRHVLVPAFDTADDATWLAAVYTDEPLVTQVMAAPGADLMWPISSWTRPSLVASLMAIMLGLLDVSEGQQLLAHGQPVAPLPLFE